MIKFYMTPYEYYPWERNIQYVVECQGWTEARRFAKNLSAFVGAYIRLDDRPGFATEGELVGGVFEKVNEKLRSIK